MRIRRWPLGSAQTLPGGRGGLERRGIGSVLAVGGAFGSDTATGMMPVAHRVAGC